MGEEGVREGVVRDQAEEGGGYFGGVGGEEGGGKVGMLEDGDDCWA